MTSLIQPPIGGHHGHISHIPQPIIHHSHTAISHLPVHNSHIPVHNTHIPFHHAPSSHNVHHTSPSIHHPIHTPVNHHPTHVRVHHVQSSHNIHHTSPSFNHSPSHHTQSDSIRNGVRYDPVSNTDCYGPLDSPNHPNHPSHHPSHPPSHTPSHTTYDKPWIVTDANGHKHDIRIDADLSSALKFQQDHKIVDVSEYKVILNAAHNGHVNLVDHSQQRSIDLSNPSKQCGGWSISVPPVGSMSQSKCDDGSKSITSCIGLSGVVQDCTTLSTASDGSKTITDTTSVGPYSWSNTFKINN